MDALRRFAIAFAVVTGGLAAFGAGTFYILRLMQQTPRLDEPDIEAGIPQRAAGITPAPALAEAAGSKQE